MDPSEGEAIVNPRMAANLYGETGLFPSGDRTVKVRGCDGELIEWTLTKI
jgi:hypothetical protein